jgi:uncharacterized membrane protein YdjX (TVP38/TMEM64 family)
MPGRTRKRTWLKAGAALVLAVAVPVLWATIAPIWFPKLSQSVRDLGAWGPIAFTLVGALAVALCGPASLLYMTGGMVFGALGGTLWGALAGACGSALAFLLARSAFGRHVARALSKSARLDRFERALSERGLWLTVLLRLSLLFPIGPVSYALGLSRIPARYFLLSMPALLPAVFTYSYAGHVAHDLLSAQQRTREPWEWVVLGSGLLATAAAAWLVGRAATRALEHGAPQAALQGSRRTLAGAVDRRALLPPKPHDHTGKRRTVGVEVEFAVLDLESASKMIQELFGGEIVRVHEYEIGIRNTSLGDFRVEVDSHPLHELASKRRRGSPIHWFERTKGALLGAVAETITPHELATPPVQFEQLADIDRLLHALGRAGAEGTDDSLLHVLGVHFNPSVPSSDPRELRDYIRAYVLLHEELVEALHVDPARRVMRFATAYPVAYARKVLDFDYAPDLGQLIDDYLEHNPTRNRGLDLLPLFKHLDAERVERASSDPRIGARPTFHFRLPNSEIGDPAWRVSDAWKLWLEVERLASEPARLAALSRAALDRFEQPFWALRTKLTALRRPSPDQR